MFSHENFKTVFKHLSPLIIFTPFLPVLLFLSYLKISNLGAMGPSTAAQLLCVTITKTSCRVLAN